MCIFFFFQGVSWRYLLSKVVWVRVCVWEVSIRQGTVAGCARGSEELLAAARVRSGLIYRDPWLLPLLLPASLAFCSLFDFLPEGWVRAVESSPARPAASETGPETPWSGEEVDIMG